MHWHRTYRDRSSSEAAWQTDIKQIRYRNRQLHWVSKILRLRGADSQVRYATNSPQSPKFYRTSSTVPIDRSAQNTAVNFQSGQLRSHRSSQRTATAPGINLPPQPHATGRQRQQMAKIPVRKPDRDRPPENSIGRFERDRILAISANSRT